MTTHDTRSQLLAEIAASPEDDTARLAFADYLEENDRGLHARFVRDQISGVVRMVPLSMLVPLEPLFGVMSHQTARHATAGGCVVVCDRMELVFRRGLVGEVRLPAAAFTERFARELFSRHPVVKVVLTDREPAEDHRGQDPVRMLEYLWRFRSHRWDRRSAVGPSAWDVPPPLWPFAFSHRVYSATRRYATRDAAASALSAWCVAWGRSLAGLPPLPAQTPEEG